MPEAEHVQNHSLRPGRETTALGHVSVVSIFMTYHLRPSILFIFDNFKMKNYKSSSNLFFIFYIRAML
jgi:hypothetical protein